MAETSIELVDNRTPSERRGDPGARKRVANRVKRGSLLPEDKDVEDSPNKLTQSHRDKMFRAKEVFIENAESAALSVVDDMKNGESAKIRLEAKRIILERALGKAEATPSDQIAPKTPVFNIFVGGKPVDSIDGIIVDGKIIMDEE